MYFSFITIFVAFGCLSINAENCPQGGEIFDRGIDSAGKATVVHTHNVFRLQLANGEVKGQPKASNMQRMKWNDELAQAAKVVSLTCEMQCKKRNISRTSHIGENIFKTCDYKKTDKQNWSDAVESWFSEKDDFIYPNITKPGKMSVQYTQVAWATSNSIGCDYIFYNETNILDAPYCKLYTCKYGPSDYYGETAPYKTGEGCEELC